MPKLKPDVQCNWCGETCKLPHSADPADPPDEHSDNGGLINAKVSGGYDSTPGNGCGALDDMTVYQFSLCEYCIDYLFMLFRIPPVVSDHLGSIEDFIPAGHRVAFDKFREHKIAFYKEAIRREELRNKKNV